MRGEGNGCVSVVRTWTWFCFRIERRKGVFVLWRLGGVVKVAEEGVFLRVFEFGFLLLDFTSGE